MMKTLKITLLPLLVLIIFSVFSQADENLNTQQAISHSAPAPSPYQAIYQSRIKGITAELRRSLTAGQNNHWVLQQKATLLFTEFEERSEFLLQEGKITPTFYLYDNPLSKKRSSELVFDTLQNNVIDKKHPGKPLSIPKAAIDKLSVQLQIRLDLLQGNAQNATYAVVDRNRIKTYHIDVISNETITTKAGEFQTVKIKQYRPGKNKYNIIWLAKDHEFLIVKLDVFDDGKRRDSLELKHIEFLN